MPKGTTEQQHYHEHADQFFYILSGHAVFSIEGEKINMAFNDGVHAPKGMRHYIKNNGMEALRFLVISQPSTANDRINC